MKCVWAVPVIFGIALMLTISILPVLASHEKQGVIIFINPAKNIGIIEEDVTGDLYQFRIPQDVANNVEISEGLGVFFTANPENSRHATNVGCTPPCGDTGGGGGGV